MCPQHQPQFKSQQSEHRSFLQVPMECVHPCGPAGPDRHSPSRDGALRLPLLPSPQRGFPADPGAPVRRNRGACRSALAALLLQLLPPGSQPGTPPSAAAPAAQVSSAWPAGGTTTLPAAAEAWGGCPFHLWPSAHLVAEGHSEEEFLRIMLWEKQRALEINLPMEGAPYFSLLS